MKLEKIFSQTAEQEITTGTPDSLSFSIDDNNPVIFSILRDKMYTDKIGSICREVASNSRDANREAGRADIPIEIEISNNNDLLQTGDTTITFRDFGTGITPDRMANVFVKYAASTKRTTNSQTGGFGLGAKTPFAYTDSFLVSTKCYVDGVKMHYLYNAIIDGSGKGKMILISENPTTDNTGTEIIIPVESEEDRDEFEQKSHFYTLFWENVRYIGFYRDTPELNVKYEVEDFKVIAPKDGDYCHHYYYGIIDGIPYPIHPDCYSQGLTYSFPVVFNLPLDKVTISASRESIQLNDDTQKFLRKRLDKLSEYLEAEKIKFLTEHNSLKDAYLKKAYIQNNSYSADSKKDYPPILDLMLRNKSNCDSLFSTTNMNVLYNWEGLNINLNLSKHRIYRVSPSEPVYNDAGVITNTKCSKVLSSLRKESLIDLRLFHTTGKTLTTRKCLTIFNENFSKDARRDFLLIMPIKNVSQEDLDKDMEWVRSTDLKIENFDDVVPTKVKYVKKAVKNEIPARYFDKFKSPIKLKKIDNKVTLKGNLVCTSDTCFIPVESLTSFSLNPHNSRVKTVKVFHKEDFNVIFVNKKTYNKHLKPLGYSTLEEVFGTIPVEDLCRLKLFIEVMGVFESIPSILREEKMYKALPQSYKILEGFVEKGKEDFDYQFCRNIVFSDLKVKNISFNVDGFRKRLGEIFNYKFPMLEPFCEEHNLMYSPSPYYSLNTLDRKRAAIVLKNYIKTVCNQWKY